MTRDPSHIVLAGATRFSFERACRVSDCALRCSTTLVVIDFSNVEDATTPAFARLVELRSRLISLGRDLRITGLHGRVKHLYNVNRLGRVLPAMESAAERASSPVAAIHNPTCAKPAPVQGNTPCECLVASA